MFERLRQTINGVLDSPNLPSRRPLIDDHFESNIPGLFVIGELAGAPVVKLAMEQGYNAARFIAGKPDARSTDPEMYDLLIVGSGAAGLNAALEAQAQGLRVVVLEKGKLANTLVNLSEGKWIYTEPDDRPALGPLSLEPCTKEDLVARWESDVLLHRLNVRTGEPVISVQQSQDGGFDAVSSKGHYRARRVIVAIGKSGNPRKLGVPGEELDHVHHNLYSPKPYTGKTVAVIGGGNSAVEAAISLSEVSRVTLMYRGSEFYRVTKENRKRLAASNVEVILNSRVLRFDARTVTLESGGNSRELPFDHAFVLIGSEPPAAFLRSLGLHLENDWTGNPYAAAGLAVAALGGAAIFGAHNPLSGIVAVACIGSLIFLGVRGSRFAWLALTFLGAYTIYGIKQGSGHEFWPYRGWGHDALSFFHRPWSFWYTVLYTAVMTIFGIQAMKRWGFDRKDRFQIWRYVSLIGFQWVFFFLIPEFLFQWAVKYQWVGAKLAADPGFANNAWRSYGLIYAWPLFFYTFFGSPNQVWIVWGALLTFVLIPVLVLFHGKRYCSWICGCGGLAETLGDRWRHLSPKGTASIRWERMNSIVLAAAVLITIAMVTRDAVTVLRKPADLGLETYHLIVDTWLVGILPVSLYPFFGGKVWCRYWCPLAKLMELFSAVFTRFRVSRFAIVANDKCIACEDCSRHCQVGIDVMRFALKQEELTNANSSCIGCGICVTVCPMNVLSFAKAGSSGSPLVQITNAA